MPTELETPYRTYTIAAALVRDGDRILLVEQQGPKDAQSHWALPGGVVETGEFLVEAMAREVAEETGLVVSGTPRLVYIAQFDRPGRREQWTAAIFEVEAWSGAISPADPDEHILQAQFLRPAEALVKLGDLRWRVMRDPILAYLAGEAEAGAAWCFREGDDEQEILVLDGRKRLLEGVS
jgi:8-oxo-dGTP diphosphatase